MQQYTIISLALLFLLACSTPPTPLSDYPEVAVFSTEMQEDLRQIVDFMDQSVCQYEELATNDVIGCYQAFFQSLAEATPAGALIIPFTPAERASLFGKLKPETVQRIWSESQSTGQASSILAVSPNREYGEFLEQYALVNSTAKTYNELIRRSGYVSGPRFIDRLTSADNQAVPLQDERMRLLIAVQFLAMSTQ